jgi:excisionase family DNA binding protein
VTRSVHALSTQRSAPTQLLTVEQAAEYLGTGERFVRRLIAQRRIPFIKLGKHVRLERSALDHFIDVGRIPSQ